MATYKTIPATRKVHERFILDKKSLSGKSLHLSIEVRENEVLACLLDTDSNQYLAWACYRRDQNNSLTPILKEDIFNYPCSGTSVVFTPGSALLIPSAFFVKESVRDYLKQQNLIKPGETACHDFIKNNDCYSVYAVNTDDYSLLKAKYARAVFRHHSSVFVEYLLALHKNSSGSEVHVYVFAGYMDMVTLQHGKLILYNRYHIQTANDFTYFLLWVYEELKLKPGTSPCFFYGEIDEKSEMFELAVKYIKNIRLAEKTTRFTFAGMLESLPAHSYYSLFMQYLCI